MPPSFLRGVGHGVPFLLVIIPFGALFGVVAVEAGLPVTQVMAFSVLVIAGASQFTAIQLMQDGVPALIVVLAALAVNLRMVMYSAAMVPHLGAAPFWQRAVMAYLLVDQTYALAATEFEARPDRSVSEKVAYFAGVAAPVFPGWAGATWLGAVLGEALPEALSLDFALPLCFVAVVAPMLKTPAHGVAAFVSVAGALALAWVPWNLGLMAAAVLAMMAGAAVESRR